MNDCEDDCQYLLLDCENGSFYGPFETFDDAWDASDDLTCERYEIIDDNGANLQWDSPKQARLRKTDKHEAKVWDRHRININKTYHFQVDIRRCHQDPAFRRVFIAVARGNQ
jgi:hypothetical protein